MNRNFVAVNYIDCTPEYRERFEELFCTRAKAIDTMPGFVDMQVLKPSKEGDHYLIVSHWEKRRPFQGMDRFRGFYRRP